MMMGKMVMGSPAAVASNNANDMDASNNTNILPPLNDSMTGRGITSVIMEKSRILMNKTVGELYSQVFGWEVGEFVGQGSTFVRGVEC